MTDQKLCHRLLKDRSVEAGRFPQVVAARAARKSLQYVGQFGSFVVERLSFLITTITNLGFQKFRRVEFAVIYPKWKFPTHAKRLDRRPGADGSVEYKSAFYLVWSENQMSVCGTALGSCSSADVGY